MGQENDATSVEKDTENQQTVDEVAVASAASRLLKQPQSWLSKNRVMIVSAAIVATALTIGLSVGLVTRKNNRGSAAAASGPSTTTPFELAVSPLPSFGQQAFASYSSCDAFTADLISAVVHLVNNSIDANAQWYFHSNFTTGACIDCSPRRVSMGVGPPNGAPPNGGPPNGGPPNGGPPNGGPPNGGPPNGGPPNGGPPNGGPPSGGGGAALDGSVESRTPSLLDTSGVSGEADAVTSNGKYVFAVYGFDIVVVDPTNTTLLSRTTIPSSNITFNNSDVTGDDDDSSRSSFNGAPGGDGHGPPGGGGFPGGGGPPGGGAGPPGSSGPPGGGGGFPGDGGGISVEGCSESINGLLVAGNRLVVIVSQTCVSYGPPPTKVPILFGSGATAVLVYDISTVPTDGETPLTLIHQTNVHGLYDNARSVNSNAYIATSSSINVFVNLLTYFDIETLSRIHNTTVLTEEEYRALAYEDAKRLIPGFVERLLSELLEATKTTSCDNFVKLTLLQTSEVNDKTANQQQLGFNGNGVLHTLTLVTSFDASQVTEEDFPSSTTGIFSPTAGPKMFSFQDRFIFADQGWNQRPDGGWWEETYLLVFRYDDGAHIVVDSFGQVPGDTLGQFSLDVTQQNGVDYLRVAANSSTQWNLVEGYWNETQESTTFQLYVLDFSPNGTENRQLSVVGSISNISVSESIQSVHFFGDKGFISTLNSTGPFYAVDLSVPSQPKLGGALKVPGTSSYLRPVANGSQILAVGPIVNETTGSTSGLQISLFNVSDPARPKLLQRYNVPTNANGWDFSETQYDTLGSRYLEQSKLLIIPVEVNDFLFNNSFDGFVVYKIDPTAAASAGSSITPSFTIAHANHTQIRYDCWALSSLVPRIQVVSANVIVTLKGHSIASTNLTSRKVLGSVLDLDENLDSSECYSYFY